MLLFGGMARLSVLFVLAAMASHAARVSAGRGRVNAPSEGVDSSRVHLAVLCLMHQAAQCLLPTLLVMLTKRHGVSDGTVADQDGAGDWVNRAVWNGELLPGPGKGGRIHNLRLRAEAQVWRPPDFSGLVPGDVRARRHHLH